MRTNGRRYEDRLVGKLLSVMIRLELQDGPAHIGLVTRWTAKALRKRGW